MNSRITMVVAFLVCALIATGCQKGKKERAPAAATTAPNYLPAGFEKLHLKMSPEDLRRLYPTARSKRIIKARGQMAEYNPASNAEEAYSVDIKGDARFFLGKFYFIGKRLHFAVLLVDPKNCTNEYIRGMAAAMAKKTGKEFDLRPMSGGHSATARFDEGTIRVSVSKFGAECSYTMTHSEWMDWRKKANVKM